jgi:prepilin-type N-terminal cleavage/methylation domain-containing protein
MGKDKKREGDDMNTHRSWGGVRSFTLIEIMITLVIMGVLATIAIPAYQNFIEDGKSKMCEENLEALGPELLMNAVERGVVPGDLGQLPLERIEKALARAKASAGWKVKLALFLDEQRSRGLAYAEFAQELAKGNMRILVCPSDPRRNEKDHVSYGINAKIAGMDKESFDRLDLGEVLIRDSDTPTFSVDAPDAGDKRHKQVSGLLSGRPFTAKKYANGFFKNGKVDKVGKTGRYGSLDEAKPIFK